MMEFVSISGIYISDFVDLVLGKATRITQQVMRRHQRCIKLFISLMEEVLHYGYPDLHPSLCRADLTSSSCFLQSEEVLKSVFSPFCY